MLAVAVRVILAGAVAPLPGFDRDTEVTVLPSQVAGSAGVSTLPGEQVMLRPKLPGKSPPKVQVAVPLVTEDVTAVWVQLRLL